jgi:uncharacterized protein (DUF952 family)
MRKMRWLYHILPRGTQLADAYAPPSLATEGFIHASFQPDVAESARLYFPAGAALMVLQIDPQRVRHEVVATPRGPMPHITTAIPRDAIVTIYELELVAGAPDEAPG